MLAKKLLVGLFAWVVLGTGSAQAAPVSRDIRFTASDSVSLATTVSGQSPLTARPTVVEFSPYGRHSGTLDPGPAYNFLLIQIRGTGDSDGTFDALGPRTQRDVQEILQWACHQPWSDGKLALNGFSASAITVYNSLHLALPCVHAAVLKSGTWELYRDLLWPGGVSNMIVGLGVLGLIGAPATAQLPDRLQRDPQTAPGVALGLFGAGIDGGTVHTTLDKWWHQRGFRGDVNHLPILMVDGFFDVESRGAFQAYQALRGDGAHLYVIGAHDGAPAGTDAGVGESRAWLDRYAGGVEDNGVDQHPRVQLWMSDGSRESDFGGKFVRYDAADWPVPGTDWVQLALDPAKSGTANSINDGSLSLTRPSASTTQSYPAFVSDSFNSDPPNTAIIGADGPNQIASFFPPFTEMTLSEPLGLSYTTKPLAQPVMAAGPLDLDVRLSTTALETAIWAVVSDVSPDNVAHPLMLGRLSTNYPGIKRAKSLFDSKGELVQPYGVYSQTSPAPIGTTRMYHVEFWPIGNRFEAGHRIRLDLVGASATSKPNTPALNTIVVGGPKGSRLMFPVLPGSDLRSSIK